MQLSRYFTLEEFTHSATAKARGILNTPTPEHLLNMEKYTAPGMEQIREINGNHPVNVHDAYRNPKVNKLVGGTPTSAHPEGFAVDFDIPGQTLLSVFRRIAAAMRAGMVKIDQLILESSRGTIHASFDPRIGKEGHARGMIGHQPEKAGTAIDWNFYKGERP